MVIVLGLIGIGNLLGLIGLWLYLRSLLLVRHGETVPGEVVALVEDDEDHIFAPVIRFYDEGRPYQFQHPIYQNPPYRVGAEVKVVFRRGQPEKARLKSLTSLYLWPAILWLAAVSLIGAGILVRVVE